MPLTSGYFLLWHWHHQMFYPFVTISAAPARESDDLRHAMSPFSLFLSSFLGARILQKDVKEGAFGGTVELGQPSRGTLTEFTFRCSSEGRRPWTETQKWSRCRHLSEDNPFFRRSNKWWVLSTQDKRRVSTSAISPAPVLSFSICASKSYYLLSSPLSPSIWSLTNYLSCREHKQSRSVVSAFLHLWFPYLLLSVCLCITLPRHAGRQKCRSLMSVNEREQQALL